MDTTYSTYVDMASPSLPVKLVSKNRDGTFQAPPQRAITVAAAIDEVEDVADCLAVVVPMIRTSKCADGYHHHLIFTLAALRVIVPLDGESLKSCSI